MAHSARSIHAIALTLALGLVPATPFATPPRAPTADPACLRFAVAVVQGAGAAARDVGLRIVNDDAGFTLHVRAEIELETEAHGAWHPVVVSGLLARASCSATPAACVAIAPRASLTVVPWNGMIGDAQCACEHCVAAPGGRYRFVVRSCQGCVGTHETVSAPFTLPPR